MAELRSSSNVSPRAYRSLLFWEDGRKLLPPSRQPLVDDRKNYLRWHTIHTSQMAASRFRSRHHGLNCSVLPPWRMPASPGVCSSGPEDGPTSDGPAFGVDVGVTNLRLAFADSMEMRPEVGVLTVKLQQKLTAVHSFCACVREREGCCVPCVPSARRRGLLDLIRFDCPWRCVRLL